MTDMFQVLCRAYDLNYHRNSGFELMDDDVPCFVSRADCPEEMMDDDILPYLRACALETIGVVILSCTEREQGYQRWLDAAKQIGASITEGRSVVHGGYKVWLISITGTKKA